MQLISAGPSPFARIIRVLIAETGQEESVEVVDIGMTSPMNSNPDAVSANPTGKIPALIRDEGPAIYDSRVIARFLDARAGAGLYPEARLWETLTLEATAHAIMDAALLMVYEHRLRPEDKISEDWVEGQWGKVSRALSAVNARWMSHLAGPLDISHIALGCALGYLDFRLDARGWRQGNDALSAWYESFSQRESMVATVPV